MTLDHLSLMDQVIDQFNLMELRAFLAGAGPAAIGAILGVAVPLARALLEPWQFVILSLAAILLLPLRRSVVMIIVGAGIVGTIATLLGAPL